MAKYTATEYDTVRGIHRFLKDGLRGLNLLVRARHEAAYKRHERLSEFVVLGRWMLDSCGNSCRLIGSMIPGEVLPRFPKVLTLRDARGYLRVHQPKYTLSWSLTHAPVPAEAMCQKCGIEWDLTSANQYHYKQTSKLYPLDQWVGSTLKSVKENFRLCAGEVYSVQPDLPIRNDRFIDLTPREGYDSLVKNKFGYAGEKDKVDDNYTIQPGDELNVNVWDFYHLDCWRRHLAVTVKNEFQKVFESAGYGNPEFVEIENEYGSESYRGPWFLVRTKVGYIRLGWRHHVIDLNWFATGLEVEGIPADTNVSHGHGWTHCWGYSQLEQALKAILAKGEARESMLKG